jgi:hypothetical protein
VYLCLAGVRVTAGYCHGWISQAAWASSFPFFYHRFGRAAESSPVVSVADRFLFFFIIVVLTNIIVLLPVRRLCLYILYYVYY